MPDDAKKSKDKLPEHEPQVHTLAPRPRYCASCREFAPEKGPCPKCGRSVLCG